MAPPVPNDDAPGAWSASRIGVVESLWGEGFILPGGPEEIMRLARPLGLSNATSLLLLGVGSGGPAFTVTGELGCWVSGFEAEPQLAALGVERATRAGLAKRAQIAVWDPADPNFAKQGFHHALLLQALRGAALAPVLTVAARAVRPGGHLVMLDLVADAKLDPADPAIAAWARLERRPADVPTEAAVTKLLTRLGFDVRVAEDISARHMAQALHGWHAAIRMLDKFKPGPAGAAIVVREAELWLRRVRLMQAGTLRLVRWHSISNASAGNASA
jgi:SAM-dependent methyltransferase